MQKTKLNIAQICLESEALGPGKRFILWVQGCPFQCKGCISPDWIPFKKAMVFRAEDLAKQILCNPDLDGITISGGEPFMQAKGLSVLLEFVKAQNPELNVVVYTGFELEKLGWEAARQLLQYVDVLKTGLYIDKKNDNQGLRGSSNQRFHFLTDRLKSFSAYFLETDRTLEFHVDDSGVLMVGIPDRTFEW